MKGYVKGNKIIFLLKNANHLRRFCTEKSFVKPIITYKVNDNWEVLNS